MKSKYIFIVAGIVLILSASLKQKQKEQIRNDFREFFEANHSDGSFVLYNQNADSYIYYNKPLTTEMYSPASTFKICNSLIGLETGVIKDADFVIPWDSIERSYYVWNQDTDLKSAFKNSTVWYYQELARRVGKDKMNYWLIKSTYGNADTTGGIDQFWLTGGLRVSPKQQIQFLRSLRNNTLPFSERSMDIVKDIMVAKDTLGYVVRAKTGWGSTPTQYIGWYVGYIEKDGNVYYFSTCMLTRGLDDTYIRNARKEITYSILNKLNIIHTK